MFALTASGKLSGRAAEERALEYIAKVNLDQVRRQLSAHAVGRHEAARRHRARHGDGARRAADGRALRRARRADPAQDAGRAAAALGRHALHRAVRDAFDRRGDQDRQPHPAAVAASRAGQGRDQQPAAGMPRESEAAKARATRSTACCSPTRSRRRRWSMADSAVVRDDVFRETIDASQFGVVQQPLSTWERIYNIAAVRKLAILVVLALIWEVYARWLNNPLLFPTFASTIQAFVRGDRRRRTARQGMDVDQGAAHRLQRRHRARRAADGRGDHLARRHRPARDAHLDVQSAAGDRAAAAGADLVRAGQRQPGLRADPLGAVGGGAEHAFRIPVGVEHAAHGGPQLRTARLALRRHASSSRRRSRAFSPGSRSAGRSRGER